jgi:hypothetical protein
MARRWLPIGLALLAAGLDAFGSSALAFHMLLIAVPAAAFGALCAFAELLDLRAGGQADPPQFLQPVLSGLGLALLVASAAVRAPALGDASAPALAANVLSVSLGLLCLEAVIAVLFEPRPARVREAAPRPRLSPGR